MPRNNKAEDESKDQSSEKFEASFVDSTQDAIELPLEQFMAKLIEQVATDPSTMSHARAELNRYWKQFDTPTRKANYQETKTRLQRIVQIAEGLSQEFATASVGDS